MTLTATQPKKIYIRVDEWWQPWANTVAYYKLETDGNDYSWNWNNWQSWNVTYGTWSGKQCAHFNGNWNCGISLPALWSFSNLTMSVWVKTSRSQASTATVAILAPTSDNKNIGIQMNSGTITLSRWDGSNAYDTTDWSWTNNVRHNIIATYNSSWAKLYVDWVYIWQNTASTSVVSEAYTSRIGSNDNQQDSFAYYGYASELIIENVVWSATDVANYYNDNKANYWIS